MQIRFSLEYTFRFSTKEVLCLISLIIIIQIFIVIVIIIFITIIVIISVSVVIFIIVIFIILLLLSLSFLLSFYGIVVSSLPLSVSLPLSRIICRGE